ncbi:MAG: hypothetical protein J0L98_13595 [Zoogloea sp.]|nr:hypothetical protein [Zoogloea sp.]
MCTRLHRQSALALALLVCIPSLQAAGQGHASLAAAPLTTPGDLDLRLVRLDDAARLISQIGKTNVVVTSKVADKLVSLYMRDVTVEGMVRNLSRAAGVWYRYDPATRTFLIMDAEQYQRDIAIARDEVTRSFTLRHTNVVSIANAIRALYGNRVSLSMPVEEQPPVSLGATQRTPTGTGVGTVGVAGQQALGARGVGVGNTGGVGAAGGFGNASGVGGSGTGIQGNFGAGTTSTALAGNLNPGQELVTMGQDRIARHVQLDEKGNPVVDAADVLAASTKGGPPIQVTYNRQHNLLLVRTGDDDALASIQRLVADMDRQPKQVLLEMKILEVTLDNDFRSIFDIGVGGRSTSAGPVGLGNITNSAVSGTSGAYARNAISSGNFAEENDPTMVWQIVSNAIRLRLQLLEARNKVSVLASPMLVASNNQPARLFIGDERVLTVGASSDTQTGTTGATNTTITVETEKRNVGQTLTILPRINADRSVSLTIDQDSSTLKAGDATIPLPTTGGNVFQFPIDTVNTANLQVTAHAQDGLTVAVGGMIRQNNSVAREQVPVLGDIPGIGVLFRKDVKTHSRSQIVLLITPRVMENGDESDRVSRDKAREAEALQDGKAPPTRVDLPESRSPGSATPPPVSIRQQGDELFVSLARAAARAVRNTDPTAAPPDRLAPVALVGREALSSGDINLMIRPAASWSRDGYYVTALQLANLGSVTVDVGPGRIPGKWEAVVVERQRLRGAPGGESWSWAYAISRQPFDQAREVRP